MGTLTYAGPGQHDPRAVRSDLASFFRSLRGALGGQRLPYVWVPEWHKTHGLHAHFAVGQFIGVRKIEAAWGHGYVFIKRKPLNDLPVGTTVRGQARIAARYLSKYVGKDFDAERPAGLHRYEVAQGFQPRVEKIRGRSSRVVLQGAAAAMGGWPDEVFRSEDVENYVGPPWVSASWR